MKEDKAMLLYEALMSGQYKQRSGTLCDLSGAMCVMGVACDISKQGSWEPDPYVCDSYKSYVTEKERSVAALSLEIREYFGFRDAMGARADGEKIVIDGREYFDLTDANDQDVPFHKIAQYIKENWSEL